MRRGSVKIRNARGLNNEVPPFVARKIVIFSTGYADEPLSGVGSVPGAGLRISLRGRA
jgi:hypothetical protein